MNHCRIASFAACSFALLGSLVVSLQACGGSKEDPPAATVDSGGGTDTATKRDVGGPPGDKLTVLDKDKLDTDADLSCFMKGGFDAGGPPADAGTDPDGGAAPGVGDPIDVKLKLTEFGGGGSDIVVGAKVDVFYKNTLIPDTPDISGTTDDKGFLTVKIPAYKPFAYRVNPNTNLRTFVYFDSDPPTTPGKEYEVTAITKSKYDQFALAIIGKAGFLTAPGTGIVSARVSDCQDRHIRNAKVELVDGTTGMVLPTGPGDTELKPIHYLTDSDLPSLGYEYTSRSGLVAAINVPATSSGKKIQMVAKGRFGGSTELKEFARVDLEITAEAVNFRSIRPKP